MAEAPHTNGGCEVTVFTKIGGPLTKEISLTEDGKVHSEGGACRMSHGKARRWPIANLAEFAALIETLNRNQAIALGALRTGLPDEVRVTTKAKLNGGENIIARTSESVVYEKGRRALLLFDYDSKGMPAQTKAEIEQRGGFWSTLTSAIPALNGIGKVMRRSTSSGLSRADKGEQLRGSDGEHHFIEVLDGTDSARALRVIYDRCWLGGFGWYIIGRGGQLLERSIVDRMVGSPERLVFEGKPVLRPPLRQQPRRAEVTIGGVLDTVRACPPLTVVEKSQLAELKAKLARALAPEMAKMRANFIEQQAQALAERSGVSIATAKRTIALQCEGILLSDIVLPFDDEELAGCTVGDVLAEPLRFEGATLADPLEGIEYGRHVARIMCRSDGTPWIYSHAHGRTTYELKLDARALQAELDKADDGQVAGLFVKLVAGADLDAIEMEELRNNVAERSGVGRNSLKTALKEEQKKRKKLLSKDRQERQREERDDPRPQIEAPWDDAPWLPMMATVLEVVEQEAKQERSRRDIDGTGARARRYAVPYTHAFSEANIEEEKQ